MHAPEHSLSSASRLILVAGCVLLALFGRPTLSLAASSGWPLAHRADVALAFGATYAGSDGGGATHRGVDLRAEAGDAVLAPCSGDVTFVGRVPGVGSSGTVLACTVERGDGIRFTLMPLESAAVSAGQHVDAGDRLAEVAERGDGSSAGTHLHVGARRGDLYVDPLGLLAPPPAASGPVSEPAPAPVTVRTPEPEPSHDSADVVPARTAPSESPAESAVAAPGTTNPEAAERTTPAEQPSVAQQGEQPGAVPTTGELPAAAAVPARSLWAAGGTDARLASVTGAYPSRLLAAGGATGSPFGLTAPLAATGAGDTADRAAGPGKSVAGIPEVLGRTVAEGLGATAAAPKGWSPRSSSDRPRALAGSLVSSLAGRGAPLVRNAASRLGRAWLVAITALLAATGALWPLWRGVSMVGEPELCLAPAGSKLQQR